MCNHVAEYTAICPPCGQAITAATEEELIRAVQAHAREEHGHDLSPDDARAVMLPVKDR